MRKVAASSLLLFLLAGLIARADGDGLPGGPFDSLRYRSLWETSPFAVATPVAVESAEYSLVGAAQFDGVSYAGVIDKRSHDHFVVTSTVPAHGLTLITLVRGQGLDSTVATFQREGDVLKLKLETAPAVSPLAPPPVAIAPGLPSPQTFSPGSSTPVLRRRPPHVRTIIPPVFIPRPPPNSP